MFVAALLNTAFQPCVVWIDRLCGIDSLGRKNFSNLLTVGQFQSVNVADELALFDKVVCKILHRRTMQNQLFAMKRVLRKK